MSKMTKFAGGRNIALKVLPHQYDATVQLYRDVLCLTEITDHAPFVGFAFGANRLWIDRVPGISQVELWLEVITDDVDGAAADLAAAQVVRCDEIEPLPQGFDGFWVSSPSSIVHLVCKAAPSE